MKKFKSMWHGSLVRYFEYGLDVFVMIFSLFTAIQVHHFLYYGELFSWPKIVGMYYYFYWGFALIYLLATAIMFKVYHTSIVNNAYGTAMKNIFLALVFMNAPLVFYAFIRQENFFFSSPWYTFAVIAIEVLTYAIYKGLFYLVVSKYDKQNVLIIGSKDEVNELTKQFYTNKDHFRVVKYLFYVDKDQELGDDIFEFVNRVDCVYLTQSVKETSKDKILDYASLMNYKDVFVVPSKSELVLINAKFDRVDDTMVLRTESMHLSFEMRFMKRFIDITVSTIGLIIAAIPMLIVALLVKIQDGGKVFYKQERFKRNNKPFYILKFRTMKEKQTYAEEQTQATAKDPRITPLGRFFRATRLDELPQLINIFKGDMSLVGPRPMMKSVMDEALEENPDFRFRSNVKPGLTGLAQIYGRYDTTAAERLRYDLLYVRKCSLWLDIKIIFLTIITVFSKEAGLGREKSATLVEILESKKQVLSKLECSEFEAYEII